MHDYQETIVIVRMYFLLILTTMVQLSLSTNILHMYGRSHYSAVPPFQHGIMKVRLVSLQTTAGCVQTINTCMY